MKFTGDKMKHIKIPWDKYEVALLIETYQKIQRKEVPRIKGLKDLSNMLRIKALNEGKQIDNIFRNYNGMCFMINSIATTFNQNKYLIHGSNLFTDIVKLYNTDRDSFNDLLRKAHSLTSFSDKDYIFHSKFGYGVVLGEEKDLLKIKFDSHFEIKYVIKGHESIKKISREEYEKNVRRIDTDYLSVDENDFNDGIVIEEKFDIDDYIVVLNKYFEDGFSYNNPIQKKKFIRLYTEEIKKEFKDSDDLYLKKITNAGFVYDNRVYPLSIISESLKGEIKEHIESNLNGDSTVIYYNSIFDSFRASLSSIFDENMLKKYISLAFKDDFKFENEFVCLKGQKADVKQILVDLFIKFDKPLNKDEIYHKIPNISKNAIDSLLNDKDFIVNYKGKSYFYKDVFHINNRELEAIEVFIRDKIRRQDYLTGVELYEYIQESLPDVAESNPDVTDLGFRNIIKVYLGDKFRFKGDLISSYDNQTDIKALYKNFCRGYEKLTIEDLESFRDSMRLSYIDYDAVFTLMIRINKKEFVRRDLINFETEIIDNAISNYCIGQYISFTDVINYIDFPTIQYIWNSYILESYVYCFSNKFKLIHATFNKEMPVGCIVKKDSNIETFDDLIVQIIKEHKLFSREKAFDFLLENNIILTRKIKNIDILIDKAKLEV